MAAAVLLLLVLFNALFALAEIAVVSSRRVRLEQAAARGDRGAAGALLLSQSPTRFLSTVQLGMTVGALATGAYAEKTLSRDLDAFLVRMGLAPAGAEALSFALVMVVISYATLVVGELVPKRLALHAPERFASLVAAPMRLISTVAAPVIALLSFSTDIVIRLLGAGESTADAVSEEEVKGMIEQGAKEGVFEAEERTILQRVFSLGDQQVKSLMVPRQDIDWLDADSDPFAIKVAVASSPHSHFPLCEGGLDKLIGVVHVKDLVKNGLLTERPELRPLAAPPVFVPESTPVLGLLDIFRDTRQHIAFVLDEYGAIEGLVTLNDVVVAIIGQVSRGTEEDDHAVVQRKDGSWLIDGGVSTSRLKEVLETTELPREDANYQTLGGLIMANLSRIPREGDVLQWVNEQSTPFRFEVVDMDNQRVDRVMVSRGPPAGAETGGKPA